MFRKKTPQRTFGGANLLMPPEKVARLMKTWAWLFRGRALPLIREEAFRGLYCPDNGRPNVPVKTIVGLLVIKEMFGLSVQVAPGLTPEEAHACQKTLHNFRTNLLSSGLGKVLFEETAAAIIEAPGIKAVKQRLDSAHIVSNIAILTRLGLFRETNGARALRTTMSRVTLSVYLKATACNIKRLLKHVLKGVPPGEKEKTTGGRNMPNLCFAEQEALLGSRRPFHLARHGAISTPVNIYQGAAIVYRSLAAA